MQSPFASSRALFGSLAIAAIAAVGVTAVMSGTSSAGPNGGAQVRMLDKCDPVTFNVDPPNGPGVGTCTSNSGGGVPFLALLASVAATGGHPEWKFKDAVVSLQAGKSLLVQNRGGEAHSFTEVKSFGTGAVPPLNNPTFQGAAQAVPLDTTLTVVRGGFPVIPPGGSTTITGLTVGQHMFQCLIHPWMRTVVTVS
jgi:plastocyanin